MAGHYQLGLSNTCPLLSFPNLRAPVPWKCWKKSYQLMPGSYIVDVQVPQEISRTDHRTTPAARSRAICLCKHDSKCCRHIGIWRDSVLVYGGRNGWISSSSIHFRLFHPKTKRFVHFGTPKMEEKNFEISCSDVFHQENGPTCIREKIFLKSRKSTIHSNSVKEHPQISRNAKLKVWERNVGKCAWYDPIKFTNFLYILVLRTANWYPCRENGITVPTEIFSYIAAILNWTRSKRVV